MKQQTHMNWRPIVSALLLCLPVYGAVVLLAMWLL